MKEKDTSLEMNATELLKELIAVRSDSGTALETAMADKLRTVIGELPYFRKHPDHYGTWDFGDPLGRPLVWALVKGRSSRTLVFTGHYDAVSTTCYGKKEALALDPDALAEAVLEDEAADAGLRADLATGKWLPGRGSNDMKAGLAIALSVLAEHEPQELSLLFTAVCDEENLSAGARAAAGLYRELQARFGLTYELGIMAEPGEAAMAGDAIPVYNGSCGKILPVLVVKGKICHGARVMEGLSASGLLARIVLKTELDPRLISADQGAFTQPPAVLMQRDLKEGYDVSLPEYAGAAISFTFLKATKPLSLIAALRARAEAGLREGIKAYADTYDQLAAQGVVRAEEKRAYEASVLTGGELTELIRRQPGGEGFLTRKKAEAEAAVKAGRQNFVSATLYYLRDLMHFAELAPGSCVIGIAPPYYPAANNDYLGPGAAERVRDLLAELGDDVRFSTYSQGITDMSYLACTDPEEEVRVMQDVPLAGPLYQTDFRAAAAVSFPCLRLGPRGKELHQEGERVYLPDVEEHVPEIYRKIIAHLEKARE